MCGIFGGVGPSSPNRSSLIEQLNSMDHRGPDDIGTFIGPDIGMGMCRLAIVEIEDGKQPTSHPLITLVFNGEIYNYLQLRDELTSQGLLLKNSSESEILIALYLRFGIEFVAKINGMFAIALYDHRDKSLHLLRDRIGKKPLWYTQLPDGTLLFSSEVKGLKLNSVPLTIRIDMISEVLLRGYINSPKSTFNEVHCLEPGTYLKWKGGSSQVSKYWSINFEAKQSISFSDALYQTKALLRQSVLKRMHSEREMGVFLSGGIDSSVIAAIMTSLSDDPIQSFSIGFDSSEYNEAPFAKKVAEHLGTIHHEEIIKADPSVILDSIGQLLDQPFADSSIIPTYLLSKFARQHTVVALGGDGGDEVFGGYDRYLAAPILQRFNAILGFMEPLRSIAKHAGSRKIQRLLSNSRPMPTLGHRYSAIMSLASESDLKRVLHPSLKIASVEKTELDNFSLGKISQLNRMVRSDFESYLPGDLLVKADLGSMGNSLELRSPFLDYELVQWGISLPNRYKVSNFETKHILKEIAREFIPRDLIDRPKMGFAIPRAEWLRNELRPMAYDLLTDNTSQTREWFDQMEIRRILSSHDSGNNLDHLIWPILMLEIWARNWLD